MRAGQLPESDHWRCIQVGLASKVHRRVYLSWIAGPRQ